MTDIPATHLQLLSNLKSNGDLEITLANVPVPEPKDDEILVRVQAAPINPSDLGLLVAAATPETFAQAGTADSPAIHGKIPERFVSAFAARLDQPMPVGNEGAGVVVKAGAAPEAQALLGKTVAILGGAMYSQYRAVKVRDALPLPADATAADGASCFVNPLTSQAMVETMRTEGHSALVHTAAASNLGQMLQKICLKDNVPLVNIVRSEAQAKVLKDIGAKYVVDSSKPTFMQDLIAAITETGATIAFDAIGGGRMASNILVAMEAAAVTRMTEYSRYGSNTFKQVYIYGRLDTSPTEITGGGLGFAWSLSGFLLTPFLQKAGMETVMRLRKRVVDELKTTFASHYTKTISLKQALDLETLKAYNAKQTGEKYLIDPSL
ncbi:MAG: zinc-binding dehydrogenase [Hyphomonadaceae bacterium]